MEQQISESIKAILIKIALELKKLGWKSESQSNEIDIHQNHLGMFKESDWDGQHDLPDVSVVQGVDMRFKKNEQNNVYFLTYESNYQLFVDGVGGDDIKENGDLDVDFLEHDVSNMNKIQKAASQISKDISEEANEKAHTFAENSYSEWRIYNSGGGWKADRD